MAALIEFYIGKRLYKQLQIFLNNRSKNVQTIQDTVAESFLDPIRYLSKYIKQMYTPKNLFKRAVETLVLWFHILTILAILDMIAAFIG
jgi:hypothetical protein